jgi:hypothetical protein
MFRPHLTHAEGPPLIIYWRLLIVHICRNLSDLIAILWTRRITKILTLLRFHILHIYRYSRLKSETNLMFSLTEHGGEASRWHSHVIWICAHNSWVLFGGIQKWTDLNNTLSINYWRTETARTLARHYELFNFGTVPKRSLFARS